MRRIPTTLLIAAVGALAQGKYIHDGRSAWSLAYGLGSGDRVTGHEMGITYTAKGLLDFGYSYAFMDYDPNPLHLGNAWGLHASLHARTGPGEFPFALSLQGTYTHLDAGKNEYGDPIWYEDRPAANSGTMGMGFHKPFRLNRSTVLHGESGFLYHTSQPNLGGTAGFGINASIPFAASLVFRWHEKASLILGAWYSLYLLDLPSSSKGISIGLMFFPPASPAGPR